MIQTEHKPTFYGLDKTFMNQNVKKPNYSINTSILNIKYQSQVHSKGEYQGKASNYIHSSRDTASYLTPCSGFDSRFEHKASGSPLRENTVNITHRPVETEKFVVIKKHNKRQQTRNMEKHINSSFENNTANPLKTRRFDNTVSKIDDSVDNPEVAIKIEKIERREKDKGIFPKIFNKFAANDQLFKAKQYTYNSFLNGTFGNLQLTQKPQLNELENIVSEITIKTDVNSRNDTPSSKMLNGAYMPSKYAPKRTSPVPFIQLKTNNIIKKDQPPKYPLKKELNISGETSVLASERSMGSPRFRNGRLEYRQLSCDGRKTTTPPSRAIEQRTKFDDSQTQPFNKLFDYMKKISTMRRQSLNQGELSEEQPIKDTQKQKTKVWKLKRPANMQNTSPTFASNEIDLSQLKIQPSKSLKKSSKKKSDKKLNKKREIPSSQTELVRENSSLEQKSEPLVKEANETRIEETKSDQIIMEEKPKAIVKESITKQIEEIKFDQEALVDYKVEFTSQETATKEVKLISAKITRNRVRAKTVKSKIMNNECNEKTEVKVHKELEKEERKQISIMKEISKKALEKQLIMQQGRIDMVQGWDEFDEDDSPKILNDYCQKSEDNP